ncbi:MAG TPA: hypothetical protein VGN19_01715 [Pedococcus sp.]|nr:hypothetical protein [Pedococcus sp.]
MTLYLALALAIQLRAALSDQGPRGHGQQVFWVIVDVFLVYRITKGSATAWFVELVLTGLPIALVLFAGFLSPLVIILLTTSVVQLALLLHPAIRRRVRMGRSTAGATI